jgi:glutamyl endopeptidase
MSAPSKAAHTPTSSHTGVMVPQRFFSREPSLGQGGRHPIDPRGFEAIHGYQVKAPAASAKPRLRNISDLTYGSRLAKSQTGVAAATQTEVNDTTLYPWRANAALNITVPGKSDAFSGTGWFVGPYAVITAAHAVYPREAGIYTGWASRIEVIPGLNGIANPPPFGSFSSSLFYCPDGWQSDGDLRLDYGVVLLNQGIGSQLGAFGYATYADNDLLSAVANLAGYPLDAPTGISAPGTQWYAAGNVVNIDESFIYYNLDTRAGESGSSVYRNIGDQSYAMAIHTAATDTLDRGLRIIEPVFENLQHWASMRG